MTWCLHIQLSQVLFFKRCLLCYTGSLVRPFNTHWCHSGVLLCWESTLLVFNVRKRTGDKTSVFSYLPLPIIHVAINSSCLFRNSHSLDESFLWPSLSLLSVHLYIFLCSFSHVSSVLHGIMDTPRNHVFSVLFSHLEQCKIKMIKIPLKYI